MKAKLTIVFDNYAYEPGFATLWGFACFVRLPHTAFLFDTGSNGRVLLQNLSRLGIDLQEAEALIISHPHWDHIGGLDSVLEQHPGMDCFVPDSLSKNLVRDLKTQCKSVTVLQEAPEKLFDGVHSTGEMGEVGEHSVVIDLGDGLVVITGCAHPGVEAIAAKAIETHAKPVKLLIGGFHLMNRSASEITSVIETLKTLGVQNVCPTHCSGDLAISMFEEAYAEHCLRGGTGRVIELDDQRPAG
ncbi:MAG: MBL fold metallo-hydrolase [Campylobacterales bacterium]|jgi:7,8-dihydropterin-6-yl-methyl-4-(beta-D-ribofuranosyl)aminobenzene 5'-phosphate synthase